jgi:hypothetical protein
MYWNYLDDESFLIRQYSVLYFLRDIKTIIEIGCGKNPISKFVNNKNIILIEPEFDQPYDPNNKVVHIKEHIQKLDIDILRIENPYALIIFGLDWPMCDQQKYLWDNSTLSIFESITSKKRHVGFLNEIKNIKQPTIEYDLHIKFNKQLPNNSWPPRPDRKILIYK